MNPFVAALPDAQVMIRNLVRAGYDASISIVHDLFDPDGLQCPMRRIRVRIGFAQVDQVVLDCDAEAFIPDPGLVEWVAREAVMECLRQWPAEQVFGSGSDWLCNEPSDQSRLPTKVV